MIHTSIAWKNGQWLPFEQVHLRLDDWGVIQGAVIVDRLRTIDSHPLDLPRHLARLKSNCEAIGICASAVDELGDVIVECARHNRSRLAERDFSIVVLVTPGLKSTSQTPTLIVHVQSLPWIALRYWYEHGQPLVIAEHRNVPAVCWSPQLKTRARLQYYLADQAAAERCGPHAGAVLLDIEGHVTETSAANILVVDREGNLCCPPAESILGGISLMRTMRLAEAAGLKVLRRPIALSMLESAREVILTGTSACIWPASRCGDVEFANPTQRPVFLDLRDRWIADIGFDFCQQARNSV